MIEAKIHDSKIVPLEPIPAEWVEGTALAITWAGFPDDVDIDTWAAEMDALCADNDPEDERLVQETLDILRREGKECTRRTFKALDEAERRRNAPDL